MIDIVNCLVDTVNQNDDSIGYYYIRDVCV